MSKHWAKCLLAGIATLFAVSAAHAEWLRDDKTIAWQVNDRPLWRFSFDAGKGKPFFDPLSIAGVSLTNFRPEDHPWHYGLWFSWKYINGVNYWEEDRQSGRAEGATSWRVRDIDARADGSATVRLDVTYTHPSGRVDLTEARELRISPPSSDGGYTIDWRSDFTAGKEGAVLDRTPMPGESDGRVNGGYAGFSVRLASAPLVVSVLTPEGEVSKFESDRARPSTAAIAANFTHDDRPAGSIAIWSDPANIEANAPWYVVNAAEGMRFICAAVLAPRIRTLPAGGKWRLHYRVAVQAIPWTAETLAAWSKHEQQGSRGSKPARDAGLLRDGDSRGRDARD